MFDGAVKIEFICDLGLAVKNPVPLNQGVLGHFYFEIIGEEEPLNIYGKVAHCKSHPEDESQFLVYFSFFGIHKHALTVCLHSCPRNRG